MRCVLALFLISIAAPSNGTEHKLATLRWLTGCWASQEADRGSGEMWTSAQAGSLLGVARTIRAGKTTGHEFMQIRPVGPGKIAFIANPSGQTETTFVAIELSDRLVVFENKHHDFPQRVIYRLDAPDRLIGRIEGTDKGQSKSIEYPMSRTSCPL